MGRVRRLGACLTSIEWRVLHAFSDGRVSSNISILLSSARFNVSTGRICLPEYLGISLDVPDDNFHPPPYVIARILL